MNSRSVTITGGAPWGFRLAAGITGLSISKMRKGGKADKAGLHEGDEITSINYTNCAGKSTQDAMNLLDSSGPTLNLDIRSMHAAAPPSLPSQPMMDKRSSLPFSSTMGGPGSYMGRSDVFGPGSGGSFVKSPFIEDEDAANFPIHLSIVTRVHKPDGSPRVGRTGRVRRSASPFGEARPLTLGAEMIATNQPSQSLMDQIRESEQRVPVRKLPPTAAATILVPGVRAVRSRDSTPDFARGGRGPTFSPSRNITSQNFRKEGAKQNINDMYNTRSYNQPGVPTSNLPWKTQNQPTSGYMAPPWKDNVSYPTIGNGYEMGDGNYEATPPWQTSGTLPRGGVHQVPSSPPWQQPSSQPQGYNSLPHPRSKYGGAGPGGLSRRAGGGPQELGMGGDSKSIGAKKFAQQKLRADQYIVDETTVANQPPGLAPRQGPLLMNGPAAPGGGRTSLENMISRSRQMTAGREGSGGGYGQPSSFDPTQGYTGQNQAMRYSGGAVGPVAQQQEYIDF